MSNDEGTPSQQANPQGGIPQDWADPDARRERQPHVDP